MKDIAKLIACILIVLFLLIGIAYGGWRLKRWWNYEWGYRDQVQQQIDATYEKRIKTLEEEVARLKQK